MKLYLLVVLILNSTFICPALSNSDTTGNPNNNNYGVPTQTEQPDRIVNGREAIPFRYPYIAGLLGRSGNFPMCGGSLIAPNLVLTAAHCVGPSADYIDVSKSYVKRVLLGAHDLFASEISTREVINVKKIVVHERYYDTSYRGYDIAILELERSSNKQPIRLIESASNYNLQSGLELTVAGWGTLSSGGFTSDILMDVNVDYITKDACDSPAKYNGMITDSMLCAAAPQKDACQGDSGGPLIYNPNNGGSAQNPPDPREDFLVGVVSWGYGCAQAKYPGVYANVQMLRDWVKNNGCKLHSNFRRGRELLNFNQGLQMSMQNGGDLRIKENRLLSERDGMTVINNNNDMSMDMDNRIVGGQAVDVTGETQRYPYQVGVFAKEGSEPICNGSLIASDVVLCAAHCSYYGARIKIGYWDMNNAANVAGAEEFDILFKEVHHISDVVLFKLSGKSRAQTINLVSDDTYKGLSSASMLWVIGWARNQEGVLTSSKLQHVGVNYITNTLCNDKYSGTITPDLLCAASPPGKGLCQGDSGGPLIVKNGFAADDELVGFASSGYGCGSHNYPGVYSNVHVFKSWVKDIACNQWNAKGRLCGGADTVTNNNANAIIANIGNQNNNNFIMNPPTSSNNVNQVQGLCGAPIIFTPVTPAPRLTKNPISKPTKNPTPRPTSNPTPRPTSNPTPRPTNNPTPRPTKVPTPSPTNNPIGVSSKSPTSDPISSQTETLVSATVTFVSPPDENLNGGVVDGKFALKPNGCLPYLKESDFITSLKQEFVDKCTNAECFEGRVGHARDCVWVAQQKEKRCKYHGLKCPKVCNLCVRGLRND